MSSRKQNLTLLYIRLIHLKVFNRALEMLLSSCYSRVGSASPPYSAGVFSPKYSCESAF